jgi:hypothetical protein
MDHACKGKVVILKPVAKSFLFFQIKNSKKKPFGLKSLGWHERVSSREFLEPSSNSVVKIFLSLFFII